MLMKQKIMARRMVEDLGKRLISSVIPSPLLCTKTKFTCMQSCILYSINRPLCIMASNTLLLIAQLKPPNNTYRVQVYSICNVSSQVGTVCLLYNSVNYTNRFSLHSQTLLNAKNNFSIKPIQLCYPWLLFVTKGILTSCYINCIMQTYRQVYKPPLQIWTVP